MSVKEIAVAGLGLIGGSIAKAFKLLGYDVIGVDRADETLQQALKDNVISKDSFNINTGDEKLFEALRRADAVFVCTPVFRIVSTIEKIQPFLKEGCIITDTGSTKRQIVKSAQKVVKEKIYFIGGHPMAGSHESGYGGSNENLFKGCAWILTPNNDTPDKILEELISLIKALGATVYILSPLEHDKVVAAVSHLPQVVATCLGNTLSEVNENGKILKFAGRGLKDTTRIARSSPEIWVDILLSNRDELINLISIFIDKLEHIRNYLEKEDDKRIKNFLFKAREYLKRGEQGGCAD
ncbi:prephenate dehydrogenase [Thermovenabulum gondwanense]|uniref:Prephenate dehydrogenase n=1 Tax=Thermovenabulum gondwanense TaxID=520767 RepID=A0A161QAN8_9FIRM|nr:prephenate dehydrogenase/arogenate dehydrogenase family protein [Thermovenabulum gondwanense]KYO65514.1 Prephenate dehydrogenase [Thermovenabulum gondwanense]